MAQISTKTVKLSQEELNIMSQLDNDQLRLLRELRDHPSFAALYDMVDLLIKYEKDFIFTLNENQLTPDQIALKHAFARGTSVTGSKVLRLITGAHAELSRREEQKRKQKAAIIKQTNEQ